MIIGIDISTIPYGTGVSNYTLNLVRHLIKIDKKNTYKLFFSSLRLPLPLEIKKIALNQNVKIYHYKLPPTFLEYIWNRLKVLPIEYLIGKCDVFHTSDWTQPPTLSSKTITTVHDLTPFLFPQWLHPRIINAHYNKMRQASRKCSQFICVSENTKKDLIKLFPQIDPNKIIVIYEAAEDKYSSFIKTSISIQNKKKETIQKQYGLNNFILAQGTREPRKNLKRLIKAFEIFKAKNPNNKTELAITGKYGWGKDINEFKKPYIKILGYIPEKNMVTLHASALCLAYPSLYEGFGLPIIKSFKVGTPVITSNNSSLEEIAQKAALLVNPKSTKSIANALEKLIKSSHLRKRLTEKGFKRAQIFDWTKTAKKTLNVYQSISE